MIRDDTYIQPVHDILVCQNASPFTLAFGFRTKPFCFTMYFSLVSDDGFPASFLFVSERTLFYNYEIRTPLGLSYENHLGDRCICLKLCLWQVPNFDLSISTKNRLATRQMMKVVFLNFIHRPEHQGRHRPKFYSNDARDNLNPTLGHNFFWKDFLLIFGWNDLMIMKWQCFFYSNYEIPAPDIREGALMRLTEVWLAIYNLVMDPELPLAGLKHMEKGGDHGWKMNIIFVWFIICLPYFYHVLPLAH